MHVYHSNHYIYIFIYLCFCFNTETYTWRFFAYIVFIYVWHILWGYDKAPSNIPVWHHPLMPFKKLSLGSTTVYLSLRLGIAPYDMGDYFLVWYDGMTPYDTLWHPMTRGDLAWYDTVWHPMTPYDMGDLDLRSFFFQTCLKWSPCHTVSCRVIGLIGPIVGVS